MCRQYLMLPVTFTFRYYTFIVHFLILGLLSDENCKKCLSIHWHIVSSSGGNINSLIENYDDVNSDRLVVSEKTMFQLQSASLPFSITQLLYAIQNATHHTTVIETLDVIARYSYHPINQNFTNQTI